MGLNSGSFVPIASTLTARPRLHWHLGHCLLYINRLYLDPYDSELCLSILQFRPFWLSIRPRMVLWMVVSLSLFIHRLYSSISLSFRLLLFSFLFLLHMYIYFYERRWSIPMPVTLYFLYFLLISFQAPFSPSAGEFMIRLCDLYSTSEENLR